MRKKKTKYNTVFISFDLSEKINRMREKTGQTKRFLVQELIEEGIKNFLNKNVSDVSK